MGKIFLEVVTPEKVVVSQEVDMVVAPGTEGEFGVLPGHVLFLSGIIPGEMRFNSGSETVSLAVSTGFAEVSDDKVSILVDAAEKRAELDIERAQQAVERAKARLAKGNYAFRLDVDKLVQFQEKVEAVEKLLGNDLLLQSYPETLRLAHILCTFTANEVLAMQHFISSKYGLQIINRPDMHKLLFGPFGKGEIYL